MNPDMFSLQRELITALISADSIKARNIILRPKPEAQPYQAIEHLIGPALEAIGAGWETGDYSLSQVYISGRICEDILVEGILPKEQPGIRSHPRLAIAVLDDYHFLGKRIVYSILRANGFEVVNYGRMEIDQLVQVVLVDQIAILLVSVLMLPSALHIKDLHNRLSSIGARTKLVVGGAPFRFDHELWKEVGADAWGSTASEAVEIVNRLIKEGV